jgi:hypothetical protein
LEPTPEDLAALQRVVARTKHRRYYDLVNRHHPDYEPAYWEVIRDLDASLATRHAPPAMRAQKPWIPLGERQRPKEGGCGCGGSYRR